MRFPKAATTLKRMMNLNSPKAEFLGIKIRVCSGPITFAGQPPRYSNAVSGSRAETSISPVGHARVSVADRGPGIKEIHRDLVFERFGQTDSSSSRKTGGTGLGLNICRAIVEMHNGKIDFESEYGRHRH